MAYYSDYVGMLAGVLGALMIITFSSVVKRIPFVSYLGRYSIILLLTHGLLLRLMFPVCQWVATNSTPYMAVVVTTVLTMLSYLAIIPLSCKFIPQITAQRPLLNE
jgi:fucose 4-O-acetylase-like acetyltransferase